MRTQVWMVVGVGSALALGSSAAGAQLVVDLLYGAERNLEDSSPEHDGMASATVEWGFPSGLGLGVGTDHQFEDGRPTPSGHLGWALYLSTSYAFRSDRSGPFVRAGVGAGRAPCSDQDSCGDGLYLRGSGGWRVWLSAQAGVLAEVAVSRVGRPLGGIGLFWRF